MILVFGGTTEGKKIAQIFDVIGQPYFYSTKTDFKQKINGTRISGEMDSEKITEFCQQKSIRLIVNAAHPFAIQLHTNIYKAACLLKIEIIRYERIFPIFPESPLLHFFNSYEELTEELLKTDYKRILSLTGVQTIAPLQKIWRNNDCYFRILKTALSIEKAQQSGIPDKFVVPMHPENDSTELIKLAKKLNVKILLSKESGESGFFASKVKTAETLNIPLWVVRRPRLPSFDNVVNHPKSFLKLFYQLKKTVLKTDNLRSGFTTGTCVTAAAKACFIALAENQFPETVEVWLPDGESTSFLVFPESLSKKRAACVVIKDAGDDPDVTHAKEIGCDLKISDNPGIHFLKGEGVGLVTLPGLQVAVGEPAINPVPRQMVSDMLEHLSEEYDLPGGFEVMPFVPEGKKLALKTFNQRVGVVGGISIIGTSGRVIPYSNEAFLATIKYQMSVARESGCNEIIITSGKRSENAVADNFEHLPDQAFIHFGNLIGATIKLAVAQGITKINLAIMFGKGIKLAARHLNTHSKEVLFNPIFAAQIAKDCGYCSDVVNKIKQQKLANAILSIIPFSATEPFYQTVTRKCYEVCRELIPEGNTITVMLLSDKGEKVIQG